MEKSVANFWNRYKVYIISILIPLAVGGISYFISKDATKSFYLVKQSRLTPPMWLFPLVWSVLYVLMGIGAAMIYKSKHKLRAAALRVYAVQLAVNFLWSPIFFNARAFGVAFVWLVILWLLICYMALLFKEVRPLAGYLQLPYLVWVTFAGYLTYMTYALNK